MTNYLQRFRDWWFFRDIKAAGEDSFRSDALCSLGFLVPEHGFEFSYHGVLAYGSKSACFRRGTFVIELFSDEGDLPILLIRDEQPVPGKPNLCIPRGPKGGLKAVLAEIQPPYFVPTECDRESFGCSLRNKNRKKYVALRQKRCQQYGRFIRDYLKVLIERYQQPESQ